MDLQDIRQIPWNKGKKVLQIAWNKGFPIEKHPNFKGGDITKSRSDRYYSRNSEALKESQKKYYKEVKYLEHQKIRKDALLIVGEGELKCCRCGCDELQLLEINHIDGYDKQEKARSGLNLWRVIVRGNRKVNDLNILCKACNILHYIKLNFGLDQYEIKWNSKI